MPYIKLTTSEKIEKDTEKRIQAAFGEAISIFPGKSERWLMTAFFDECKMSFAGKNTPCAMLEVDLFGGADERTYQASSEKFTDIAAAHLNIPKDRIYIKYSEFAVWGLGGSNF